MAPVSEPPTEKSLRVLPEPRLPLKSAGPLPTSREATPPLLVKVLLMITGETGDPMIRAVPPLPLKVFSRTVAEETLYSSIPLPPLSRMVESMRLTA